MSTEPRNDGRAPDDLREINFVTDFVRTATGSALIEAGGTRVICTASVDEDVPRWMANQGRGWVTAEYAMLPASTGERKRRDISKGRPDGRSVEIQRLIGRSLRGVIDFKALGERTVWIDCDVLEADGGTRCAAITGGYVALELAMRRLISEGKLTELPLTQSVAAVSCGIVGGRALLDLDYSEDSSAEVDANVVMTGDDGLVEVQATAERTPLSRASLDELLALGGIRHRAAAGGPAGGRRRRDRLERCDSSSPPATSTSWSSCGARCAPTSSSRCPTRSSCRPRRAPPSRRTRSARPAPRQARPGRPAIADDSGIEAAALNGAPGVWSARYAGRARHRRAEPGQAAATRCRRTGTRGSPTSAPWPTSSRAGPRPSSRVAARAA